MSRGSRNPLDTPCRLFFVSCHSDSLELLNRFYWCIKQTVRRSWNLGSKSVSSLSSCLCLMWWLDTLISIPAWPVLLAYQDFVSISSFFLIHRLFKTESLWLEWVEHRIFLMTGLTDIFEFIVIQWNSFRAYLICLRRSSNPEQIWPLIPFITITMIFYCHLLL
jgi:hypothetical protein